MRTIDTILFDLDDTLLDDSTAYKRAARRVAGEVAAERGVDAERLSTAFVAEANGFWKKLSQERSRCRFTTRARSCGAMRSWPAACRSTRRWPSAAASLHALSCRRAGTVPRRARTRAGAARARLQTRHRHERLRRHASREGRPARVAAARRRAVPGRRDGDGQAGSRDLPPGLPDPRAASRPGPRWWATATTATSSGPPRSACSRC